MLLFFLQVKKFSLFTKIRRYTAPAVAVCTAGYINYSSNSITVPLNIFLPKDYIVRLSPSNVHKSGGKEREEREIAYTHKHVTGRENTQNYYISAVGHGP